MALLLNPRVWIALALAGFLVFSHAFIYRAGKASVRVDWNAQKLVDADTAKKAQEQARQIETDRQKQAQEAIDASKKRETVLRADAAGARNALERLRNAIRASSGDVSGNPLNALGGPSAPGELLAQCSAEYQRLGELADQHASDVKTLTDAWPKR